MKRGNLKVRQVTHTLSIKFIGSPGRVPGYLRETSYNVKARVLGQAYYQNTPNTQKVCECRQLYYQHVLRIQYSLKTYTVKKDG